MKNALFALMLLFSMQIFDCSVKANSIVTWSVKDVNSLKEIALGEKGSVQEAYIQNGLLPDPFVGDNELLFQWMEDHKWTFKGKFIVKYDDIKQTNLILEFPSIDTYAVIKVNGKEVGTTNNAFRTWRFNVKGLVQIGTNTVEVVFTPPIIQHKEEYKKEKYHLPAPNDLHSIPIAPKTRKPQYHFGWDWAPRLNLLGFHEEVKFLAFTKPQIWSSNIQTESIQSEVAKLKFSWEFSHLPEGVYWTSSNFTLKDFSIKGNVVQATAIVNNPQLWMPNGYGTPHLYSDTWLLRDASGKVLAKKEVKFGVRKAELIQEQDQFGTSYQIRVNGTDVFCKGANIIPQEVFISKIDKDRIDQLIEGATFANVNMLRVWGGGYYPSDYFYQRCDELGIMVWQDFMFACAMYPGDDAYIENIEQEAIQQIQRIGSHPSVVLFNGNNEVDMAWKHWGFQFKYLLGSKAQREIESAYNRLFKGLLEEKVKEYTTIPYIHTSPLSNWGKEEDFKHGSQHYWGVWHGRDPIEDMGNKSGRFNAEYGFQSFPTYSTLSSFADPQDWDLNSKVIKHHQKSPVGNGMIKKHSDQLYGKTDDFMDFVYYSQLTQAKAVELAVAGHRASFPKCAGTLYWQLNDCWPAPTWSSIDYFNNYKAQHYKMRDLFKPTAVVAVEQKMGVKEFYVVTEKEKPLEIQVEYFDLQGEFIEMHILPIDLNAYGIKKLPLSLLQQKPLTEYIVRFVFDGNQKDAFYYFNEVKSPRKVQTSSDFELITDKDGMQKIRIDVKKAMLDVWITGAQEHVYLQENFKTLLPGKHEFEIRSAKKLSKDDIILKFR